MGPPFTYCQYIPQEWWRVENVAGKQGFVPANYVQKIEPATKPARQTSLSDRRTRLHAFAQRSQSITMDTPATESVKQRQTIVERKSVSIRRTRTDTVRNEVILPSLSFSSLGMQICND